MPRRSKLGSGPSSATSQGSDPPANGLHKTTHYITLGQAAFLKRKVEELRRRAPPDRKNEVTESAVIQGLLNLWMAVDMDKKNDA